MMDSKITNPITKAYNDACRREGIIDTPMNWHLFKIAYLAGEKEGQKSEDELESKRIDKFHKLSFLQLTSWAWVSGQQDLADRYGLKHSISKSVSLYKNYFNVDDTDISVVGGIQNYTRTNRKFYESLKLRK